MKGNIKKLAAFVVITVIAMFIAVAMASAGDKDKNNNVIKGQYAFTGEAACLTTSYQGFNENDLRPIADWWFVNSFSVQGVWTFNGDGTGSREGRAVGISYENIIPAAGSEDFLAPFTYTVGPDGTFTTELSSPLTGTVLTGPRHGQTFTIYPISLTGMISKDKKSLTLASEEPQIETVKYYDPSGNLLVTHKRICHRSRVLIQLAGQAQ